MKNKPRLSMIKGNTSSIFLLLAVAALGVVLAVLPTITIHLFLRIVGAIFLLSGGLKIYQYFHQHANSAIQGWSLSIGSLMVLAAITMIIVPEALSDILPILFASVLFVGGVIKFQIGFDLKRVRMDKWYSLLILSVISILLGWLTVLHPYGLEASFMRVSGIYLIFEAISSGVSILLFHRQRKAVTGIEG